MVARATFLLATLLTVGAGTLAAIRLEEARTASRWVGHSHEVLGAVEALRNAIAATDAAQYALLQAAPDGGHDGGDRARAALARSRLLTVNDRMQQQRLDTLERLLHEHLADLATTAALLQRGETDSARLLVHTPASGWRRGQLATLLARMATTEHATLRARAHGQAQRAARGRAYVLAALGAGLLLGALGVMLLRRAERRARAYALAADQAAEVSRAAEAAHRESVATARRNEARFRTALDAMSDAFFLAAPTGTEDPLAVDFRLLEVNEAGAALLGGARAELAGTTLGSVRPDPADPLLILCRGAFATRTPYVGELQLAGPAAAPRWVRLQIAPTAEGIAVACADITDAKQAAAALAELADRDELTNLLNRRGFRQLATQELRTALRVGRRDAIVSLDLTGFKQINDVYGHGEGDAALREVARLLQQTCREGDIVARPGGDEFVVYAPGASTGSGAEILVGRIRQTFAEANVAAQAAGRPYQIETGIGVATLRSDDDLDSALARADTALYADKRARLTAA